MPNLEHAYQELKSAMTPMDREEFEDELLQDSVKFGRYAAWYVTESDLQSFLDYAWSQYQREVTPAHTEGWRPETAQPDFHESYHDHLRRMAGEEPDND